MYATKIIFLLHRNIFLLHTYYLILLQINNHKEPLTILYVTNYTQHRFQDDLFLTHRKFTISKARTKISPGL